MYIHKHPYFHYAGGRTIKNINSTLAVGLLSHFERFANVIFNVRERREDRRRVMAVRSISSADGERNATWMKGRMHER